MKNTIIIIIIICCNFVYTRDFHEPLEMITPLSVNDGETSGIITSGYADVTNVWHILKSQFNSYYNRILSSFTLFRIKNKIALNLFYGIYLTIGPVLPSETPVTIAPFWINAVQFEYGLVAGFMINTLQFIIEYARTSQHPIRSGYSEVTTDTIKTGFALPAFFFGEWDFNLLFYTGFIDLFDFWKSPVSKPRTLWIFSQVVKLCYSPCKDFSLYLYIYSDLHILRNGYLDFENLDELGFSFRKKAEINIFSQFYHSGDTEELKNQKTPVDFFSIGLRLSIDLY